MRHFPSHEKCSVQKDDDVSNSMENTFFLVVIKSQSLFSHLRIFHGIYSSKIKLFVGIPQTKLILFFKFDDLMAEVV